MLDQNWSPTTGTLDMGILCGPYDMVYMIWSRLFSAYDSSQRIFDKLYIIKTQPSLDSTVWTIKYDERVTDIPSQG